MQGEAVSPTQGFASPAPECRAHAEVPVLSRARLALFIGLRYAFGNRGQGYLSFVSVFSLAAMTLGVTILIVVLSVMNGFDREIKRRMLDVVTQATLSRPEGLADWAALGDQLAVRAGRRVARYVEGQALVGVGGGQGAGGV